VQAAANQSYSEYVRDVDSQFLDSDHRPDNTSTYRPMTDSSRIQSTL